MSDELPKGWVWAKMLDILDYEGGSQPPKKEFIYEPRKGYVRLMQIRDFGDKPFPTYVPDGKRLKKATRDDLLLARYGGSSGSDSLGRICTGLDGAYNVALAKLVFSSDLLEKGYVRCLFLGPWFREKVSQNSRSCQTGFNREDVEDIEFPIAPLPEQRRIVAKLETLLGKVDASQQRLAKVPVLLKRFRQSVLAAACSGRLTADWREENPNEKADSVVGVSSDDLPDNWKLTKVERLAKIGSGQSSNLIISQCATAGEIPWFKVSDMNLEGNEKFMRRSQNYLSAKKVEQFGMKLFPKDTIIFPKRGGAISTNKKRILTRPSCIDSNTMALTAQSSSSRYFSVWFSTIDLGQLADGSSVPQINNPDILPLGVPWPPLAEQQEIVRRVDALFALADQIEARYAKAAAHVEKLTQSILAKAFRGELVPQDPNDEPASMLLERIKGRQNENESPKRKFKNVQLSSGSV